VGAGDQMSSGEYTCLYCRLESDGGATTCPHCGAPVDVAERVSRSGWVEQPPIRDMTRLRFGHSSCQISGSYVPAAEMRLGAGDSVSFPHHALLHADPGVDLGLMRMPQGWQRSKVGLPVYVMNATGPGHLAISADEPGETIAVPMPPGHTVDVTEHRFLAATGNLRYDWLQSGIWFTTKDGDSRIHHYPLGGAYLSLHTERSRGGSGYFMWVELRGPGRVAIKSTFGPAGWNGKIVASSPRTTHAW
jgi:hypothetical protein